MDTDQKIIYNSINEAMERVSEMASSRGAGIVFANDFGSKGACFSVTIAGKELFFSYATLVAVSSAQGQFKTSTKFSTTTTKHMSKMGVGGFQELSQEELERLAAS